jgi:ubiquitin carboxyl-terminal hydrolase 4/11
MLSVPIPNDSYVKFNCYFIPATGVPLKIDFNIIANTTVYELKRKIAIIGKTNPEFMVVGLIKTHKLQSFVRDDIEASQLCAAPEIVFVYEIPEINPKYQVLDETIFLSKVYIYVPAREHFQQKEMKAFTRIIAVEPSDSFRDIKLKIYKRIRRNLKGYYQSQNNDRKLDLENEFIEQIEKEYNYYFAKDQEDMWPYNIQVFIQYANFTTNLESLDDSMTVDAFLKENRYSKTQLSFNLVVSRFVRFETLQMNSCLPFTSNEDQNFDVKRNYNLNDCLALFTREERLSSENAWVCPKCKANKLATKKMEIYRAPENLIIHLKRFKNVKYSGIGTGLYSKKLSQFVEFPLTDFDIKKYILPNADDSEAIYDLYAITNHYGELGGGHYTAYAKNALDNAWYDFNDSSVRPAMTDDLVSSAAYILFYKRRK